MHKSLKAFLSAQHIDRADRIAHRALTALAVLEGQQGLINNADNRGNELAFIELNRAHYFALAAFALIDFSKNYPFAEEVESYKSAVLSWTGDGDYEATAEDSMNRAEEIINLRKAECTPVCMIHGIGSVAILRGVRAAHAMHGVVPANSNAA